MSPLVWLGDLALSPVGLAVWLVAIVLGYLELQHCRDRRRKIAWLRAHGDVVELAPAASQLRRPRVPPTPRRERRP